MRLYLGCEQPPSKSLGYDMTKGKARIQHKWSSLIEKNKNPKKQRRSQPVKAWRFQNLLGRAGRGEYDILILEGEADGGESYYFLISAQDISYSPMARRNIIDVTFPIHGPAAQRRLQGISRFVWKHQVSKEELRLMVDEYVARQRSPDYTHEGTLRLDNKIAELAKRRNQLGEELRHAQALCHLDMRGQMVATEDELKSVEGKICYLERAVEIVKAGFPFWERSEFQASIDGLHRAWEVLSEALADSSGMVILSHENTQVRLPVEVQERCRQAAARHFFDQFEVCTLLEPPDYPGEQPVVLRRYLFGRIRPIDGGGVFLVAEWDNGKEVR